jgi:hypothetical protein
MAVTVSYELSIDYTIPEELLEKMDELNEDPEPVSLDSDGTLTVELDGSPVDYIELAYCLVDDLDIDWKEGKVYIYP